MVTKVVYLNSQKANQRKANNTHEETKKVIFVQSAWAALKVAIEKLMQDLFLREKMSKEWALVLESERAQSLKDTMQKLFLAILKEIKQKLNHIPLTPQQRKAINDKLDNLFKQVDILVNLKAEFAAEQPAIADRIDAIEASWSEIESELKSELAAPLIKDPAKLKGLDKKAEALSKEVDSARGGIKDWLRRFSEVSEAKENSLEDLTNYTSKIDAKLDFMKPLEEVFGKGNINFDPEKEQLQAYGKILDAVSEHIAYNRTIIAIRLANPNVFWDVPARIPVPAPRPSFSTGKSLEDEGKPKGLGI